MTRKQLQFRLDSLLNDMNDISQDFVSNWRDNLQSTEYIVDSFVEFADNNVDIYYNELFDWAKENTSAIDETLQTMDIPKEFIKIIQYAQYNENNNELYEDESNIIYALGYCYALDYLEEDKLELIDSEIDIDDELASVTNSDRFSNISDIIDELIQRISD